ncbi:MAG: BatA domain-containing protein [Oscillospiraceae bacterium]|nr:BatA domain-containing protein [Oscillospiraceae bacterium]
MRFMNPAGLWLLLGVPVLIIIYLIKAQHEDRPVSSTFIWKLSSRFMKKRLPVQRIKKLLAFLLQLLLIVGISLMVARPAFNNGKSRDYIAIVDASASMQTKDENGTTRFDRALEEAEELAKEIDKGHTVSIILAGDKPSWLLQRSVSPSEVRLALEGADCAYGGCDTAAALALAQQLCERSKNPQVMFFTDNSYTDTKNIQAVDLSNGEWNVAVTGAQSKAEKASTEFTGTLISHHRDATLTVGLRINGQLADAKIVDCVADTETTVSFVTESKTSYDTAEVFVETSDALQADNSYAICRSKERTYRVMLVSRSPLYLESALNALGTCQVTVAASPEEAELTGYDLYVFDCVAPQEYPQDGSVLVFGTQMLPEGLTAGSTVTTGAALTMELQQQSDLFADLTLFNTAVTNYKGLHGNLFWKSLFFCEEEAVLATREMGNGLQFTVVSFDLRDSNLPMQTDFLLFMRNLVEYSVPAFLKDTDHTVGSSVTLTVMPGAEAIYVELPDDSIQALSTAAAVTAVTVDAVGIYTAVMTTQDSGEYVDFFVHVPESESRSVSLAELSLELPTDISQDAEDAISELWFWVAVIMLITVLGEWGWYYHEQY